MLLPKWFSDEEREALKGLGFTLEDGDLPKVLIETLRTVGTIRDLLTARDHQTHAARYVFHKVTVKRYGDAVATGIITRDQGEEMYRRAMENYDEIVAAAAGGALTPANEADMEEGFKL